MANKIFILMSFLITLCFGYTDALDRKIEVKSTQKLVFIGPGALRLGVYLGLEDRLVGIENLEKQERSKSPYNEVIKRKNLQNLPVIGEGGPGKMPSMEAIINSKADMIVASFVDKEQVRLIEEKTKIPVFILTYGSGYGGDDDKLAAVKKSILKLGEITNKLEKAQNLLNFMDTQERNLKSLKFQNKSVYIGGIGYKGAWGIASTESDYLPFSLLGVKNALTHEKKGHLFLDMEKIAQADPDIIFLDKSGKRQIEREIDDKKAFFDGLKAFKTGQIFWVDTFNFYNTNIENCFIIAYEVAAALGANIDVDEQKRLIKKEFLGEF